MRLFLIVPMLITFESIKLPKQLSSRLLIVILIQVLLVSFGVGIFSFLAGLRFKQLVISNRAPLPHLLLVYQIS